MTELVIEVAQLVKTFGTFRALDGLDLQVRAGEVHGFLGPNGAGKSTTLRVLLGLYRATSGQVRVLGLDPARHAADVTRRSAYVPGDVALWPSLTGQEVLDALAGLRGGADKARQARLVDAFALDPAKKVRAYSKGNRQKVALIAAFSAPASLIVLDEPTAGLDPLMEETFQACVRDAAARGQTVLLSSHVLSEVDRICDSVTIIKDGRTVEHGRLSDLRHLAASHVTATVPEHAIEAVRRWLAGTAGLSGGCDPAGRAEVQAAEGAVPVVLQGLLDAGAAQISCTPATLDDLFLRHYAAAAR